MDPRDSGTSQTHPREPRMIGPDYEDELEKETRTSFAATVLLAFLWYTFVAFLCVIAASFWIEVGRRIISLF